MSRQGGTGHTGTYQAGEQGPTLIVVTPYLVAVLDNVLAVLRRVARGEAGRAEAMRELEWVKVLHDFERFNLGGDPR